MGERTLILDDRRMARTVERMAWQVLERHREGERLVLAGVRNSGYSLAQRIQTHLKPHIDAELIEIEVNKRQPTMEGTRASASASSLEGAHVVVVDDVLNSGATLLYALSYFLTASM